MSDAAAMPDLEAARIAAIAQALSIPPSAVLTLAARVAAQPDVALDAARLRAEAALAASDAGLDAARLLRLGFATYAKDDLERALAMVWLDADLSGP